MINIDSIIDSEIEIFLEIGSGDKKGVDNWFTIDMSDHCDIKCDVTEGLPFPDNSISKIYSEHFLEHLTYKEGQIFLIESLRVLKPEGDFLISVPNARLWIEAYLSNKNENTIRCGYEPAFNNTTKIDFINYIAYMDTHHKYMFDEENLLFILMNVGFNEVSLRDFDNNLDLEARRYGSVYAKAKKANIA